MTEPKAGITRAGKLLIVIGLTVAVIGVGAWMYEGRWQHAVSGLLLLVLDLVAVALLATRSD